MFGQIKSVCIRLRWVIWQLLAVCENWYWLSCHFSDIVATHSMVSECKCMQKSYQMQTLVSLMNLKCHLTWCVRLYPDIVENQLCHPTNSWKWMCNVFKLPQMNLHHIFHLILWLNFIHHSIINATNYSELIADVQSTENHRAIAVCYWPIVSHYWWLLCAEDQLCRKTSQGILSIHVFVFCCEHLWPLLLTCINFNPSMDK